MCHVICLRGRYVTYLDRTFRKVLARYVITYHQRPNITLTCHKLLRIELYRIIAYLQKVNIYLYGSESEFLIIIFFFQHLISY